MVPQFSQSQVTAIAAALGDTSEGLTGTEIAHFLQLAKMADPTPDLTKRHRLHNAFATNQNQRGDRRAILSFIRHALKPERYIGNAARYETMRANTNRALAFAGLAVD